PSGDREYRRFSFSDYRTRWQQPLPFDGAKGNSRGSLANPDQHLPQGDTALSNLVGQGGQCASFDCGGSGNWCIRHLSRPEFPAIWWRGLSNQPDHAGTMPISEPKAPRGFDHSPDPDKRYC